MDIAAIQQDFASFADPGSTVEVTNREVTWKQERATKRVFLLDTEQDIPNIKHDNDTYSYSGFFASEHMADLYSLAQTTTSLLPTQPGYVGNDYIDGLATFEDSDKTKNASRLFEDIVSPSKDSSKTKLYFIRGRAGDGKSVFLVHLTLAIARKYTEGRSSWLYLYVNAQGSSLARIDEVMAKVSQDLRARFTYHAIATLTRIGLIVPVIDGFDELLGVGGYKDAFSSLASFVSRLRGRGSIIASARSTFYQYTDFGTQAARYASDENPLHFETSPIILNRWTDREADNYLKHKEFGKDIGELKEYLGDRSEEIISSPFLLSRLCEQERVSIKLADEAHVVRLIVEELVQREMVTKLLDPQGRPLLTLDQHMELLGAIAEEMWWQEVRELDEQTFITIAELLCEDYGLAGDVAVRFLHRVPSYALLSCVESPTRIGFRHEFYFAFFLGERVGRHLVSGEDISVFLRRATLSAVIGDEIALSIANNSDANMRTLIENLNSRRTTNLNAGVANGNAGTIVWALIRRLSENMEHSELRNCHFDGADFGKTKLRNVRFFNSTFSRCDFSDVDWNGIEFKESSLTSCTVSPESTLGVTGIRLRDGIVGLQIKSDGRQYREIYSQEDIAEFLRPRGMEFSDAPIKQKPLSDHGQELIRQLDLLIKVVRRTLYFSESDFKNRRVAFPAELQPVLDLLEKHGLFLRVKRQRKGSRELFRLTEPPEDIRRGESGIFATKEIRDLWVDIRAV